MRPRVHFRYAVRSFLSFSLIAALLAPFALVPIRHSLAKSSQGQNNQGRPEPGHPAATLPNLNKIRTQQLPLPKAPPEIPSTLRSNRNPLAPRNGRKVGDPLPALGQATAVLPTKNEQRRPDLTAKVVARTAVFHHVRTRAFSPPPVGDDQYVQSFFQSALARQPHTDESAYWADILRSAYAHAQTSMVMSARELGKTLFESAEYAARVRNNHDYVYDLYWAFLLRAPDPGGWAYWEGQVPTFGREGVRRAFDESPEFASVVGTITPNGSASSGVYSLLTRRLEGVNQPGSGLLSRDAEWSLPILSLPGRAGLDLGLALSYSSAVWTRSGPYIYFDDDNGFPSPGFRLGFPTVQELFFNAQAGQNAYLLITSGGNRIELRQIGTSNVYEAVDSSYLQLTDNGSSLLVRSTDGTQMGYTRLNNEWRCNQIKDRNGNYITVNYDWLGHITSIIDTLNRSITFNYDGNANLTSITQTWDGQTHYWATFGWDIKTMQSDVSGVAIVGAQNYTQIPVLTQVGLPDGFRYNFEYTNWLQASIFRRYSSTDNVQRAYTAVDYQYPPADCPRLANSRQWAVNWTGINGVPTEVVTQYFDPGDGSHYVIRPDGTVYQEFYGTGWQSGLVTTTFESAPATGIEKWTTTAWTQDDINLAYKKNPRPTESNVYDSSSNRRRTRMDYYTFTLPDGASCSLSTDVYDYASDGNNILRRTHTDYDLNPAYLSRRLIGLINSKYVYDGNGALQSKTGFYYDSGGGSSQWLTDNGQVTQHDYASYPKSFDVGRGNLCFVQRFDVTNLSVALTYGLAYDIMGNVVASWDPLSHNTSIGYNDSFSEGGNRNTFAYPTTVTDPDGFSTYTQYNYDFGAQTRVQGPPPQGQSQGIIQTTTYDNAARIDTLTTTNNGAYTRFWYGPDYAASFSSANNVADELFTNRVFDGAGRLIGVSNSNPGSLGGYKARLTQYDLMGRVMKQSNPEEIDGWWTPYGDDAAGWLYTQQTYDWKGRPRITTNPDNTIREASYSGCGCAGGEVVTLTDEGTGVAPNIMKRQQKVYSDVLGRTLKTEVLNWDGPGPNGTGGSVYSATVNTYNVRDQVTQVRQYAGPEGSGTYQDTTMDYDGYGRLKTRHVPEQTAGTATTWDYNNDDTIQKITDARGASATFGYVGTNRHLVKKITYAAPSGISVPGEVTFNYDAAGNRTSMTDGLGSTSYNYNELSRLTSETRVFTGVGTFPISYSYNLAGQLTSVTDPFGAQIGYVRDGLGRTTSITGSGFAGISSYVSNIQYRAWGASKSASYGNNTSSTTTYTARLQPWQFRLTDNTYGPLMREDYTYNADGSFQLLTDLDDTIGSNPPSTIRHLGRGYGYDNVGRVTGASGIGAGIPLSQNYGYDAFGNMSSRSGSYYNYTGQQGQTDTATFTNNRRNGWNYDADGRVTSNPASSTDDAHSVSYDAAGRMVTNIDYSPNTTINYGSGYDGDGQLVSESSQFYSYSASYIVRSSVLGDVLTRLDQYGNKQITHVLAEGLLFATQRTDAGAYVIWTQRNPLGISEKGKAIYDPLGNYIPFRQMSDPRPPAGSYTSASMGGLSASQANPDAYAFGCLMDGIPTSCNRVLSAINNGQARTLVIDATQNNALLANMGWFLVSTPTQQQAPTKPPKLNHYKPRSEPGKAPDHTTSNEIEWGIGLIAFDPDPQNPRDDDPDSIQVEAKGVCSIKVSFKGQAGSFKFGAGPRNLPGIDPGYGVTFAVTGSVQQGEIGKVDTADGADVVNPNGSWTLQQWQSTSTHYTYQTFTRGQIEQTNENTRPDGPRSPFRYISGNKFGYVDFPGPVSPHKLYGNITYFSGETWFAAKVINGNQQCEVKFHISISFANGNWTAHWGNRSP